ncbi:MAG: EamA family transporter [Methylococcaceae bacterium]|jgi:drug/metabolite transporter (DMT)-like permease
MNWTQIIRNSGVQAALGAAILFGASTPLAKVLLNNVDPWILAGLLYIGSGFGLMLFRIFKQTDAVAFSRQELPWLIGAVIAGGVIAPVLLMFGLTGMPASGASLLLNAESVFTALLAWFVFKENFDRRIALGMLAIVTGAMILSWPSEAHYAGVVPGLAIFGACLAWGVDNNLTRKVSLSDATWIACVKGLVAGSVNLILAFTLGATLPTPLNILYAMFVGFFAFGVSLTLFILALRHLGTARTGAYFSIAPFCGALIAVIMGEPVTMPLLVAGLLMALGLWLHLTERHEHAHTHEPVEHEHTHAHDEHHLHSHDELIGVNLKHSHMHHHDPITHNHAHFPDAHHRHSH